MVSQKSGHHEKYVHHRQMHDFNIAIGSFEFL